MSNADLAHSQVKIAQLLETILDNNFLNLSLSEIEGDAILFYNFSSDLKPDQVVEQCKLMFKSFHHKLNEFNRGENCQCGSCKTLQQLSLKFVIHYGNLGSVMVKDYCKYQISGLSKRRKRQNIQGIDQTIRDFSYR